MDRKVRPLRHRLGSRGSFAEKCHPDEIAVPINRKKHWLSSAVDADGNVLHALLQSRRNRNAALWLIRELLMCRGITPHVMVTGKLWSHGVAKREIMPDVEHPSQKG